MSMLKSTETKPELKIKSIMKILGIQYQPKMYEKSDFANKKEKIAVFVDGCFWNKCPKLYRSPKTNKKFWREKIEKNMQRDKKITNHLKKDGWKVIRILEHDLRSIKC